MTAFTDLTRARAEVSASSACGSPFLLAFGATILATGVAGFWLPTKTAALIVMFQGNVALPLAFWMERRMGTGTMAPDNPLKALSILNAVSQIVAFPILVLLYALAPWAVPAGMAAIAGAHFLPYAWLQRTNAYIWLGVVVSAGGFGLTFILRAQALPWVLIFMGAVYWVAAAALYRRAGVLLRRDLSVATV